MRSLSRSFSRLQTQWRGTWAQRPGRKDGRSVREGGGRGKRGREAGIPKWRTVGEIGKLVRNIVPYFVSKTRQEAGTKKGKGTGTQEGGAKKGGATGTEGYRKRKV